MGRDAAAKERGKDLVKKFVTEVLQGHGDDRSRDTEAMINARIAQIDALISTQLNEVMHHPDFQKLEGTWRGLQVPAQQHARRARSSRSRCSTSRRRICSRTCRRRPSSTRARCSRRSTRRSSASSAARRSARCSATTSSASRGQDIELLEKISQVAAAAHAPFLTAASAGHVQHGELHAARRAARHGEGLRHDRVREVEELPRRREDSRYVALTLPRILMREPYGADTVPVEAFDYEEHVDGTDHSKYLWGNAAWALGARVTQAFATYGWCATIRGVESGGLVEGSAGAQLHDRVRRHRHEVPDRDADLRSPREGAGRPRLRAARALQGHATTPRSSACSRRRSPRSTTPTRRRRMRGSRRSCRTSSPCRGSRTISSRSCATRSAGSRRSDEIADVPEQLDHRSTWWPTTTSASR